MLSDEEVERFVADGFLAVRRAIPPEVLSEWQEELNPLEVRNAGVVLADPTTSVEPVLQHEKLVSQREDLGVAPVAGGEHLSEP